MTLDEFLREIRGLSKPGKGFKPHKYIVLLTVIELIRQQKVRDRCIFFDADFKRCFSELLRRYGIEGDRDRPHTPFFHLSSADFWELVPKQGRAAELARASTIGSGAELLKLVDHAELDASAFEFLADRETRKSIELEIRELLERGQQSRSREEAVQEPSASHSLFKHEQSAIRSFQRLIAAHALGQVLHNLELHDRQSNRYFEIDLVVVCRFGIYVVELKHWSGEIEIRPNSWVQNRSFFKPDPHKANSFKAKLVRGLCERQFPHFPPLYCESVVVFTNPEATVVGASLPKTTTHNPTFDSIKRFIDYLKHRERQGQKLWTDDQCEAFTEYLNKLRTTARPRDFLFPGYEIVERLYQHTDRAEVVARRTDIRHRRLTRLRIFFPPTGGTERDKRVFHERATATLNAVAKTGDHPNILKVWSVPNENNYIVEGSDWSETGTLRDVLDQEGKLHIDRVKRIVGGILSGLEVLHRECVVHRALSPDNILMVEDTPKLMNFDLSYQLEEDRTTVIPDVSKLKRSPYIAPEVYRGSPPEATADIFSVGVILYEMLTGGRPFGCSTDLERSGGQLASKQREVLRKHGVPPYLEALVLDLVRLDPDSRPGKASDVLERLQVEPLPTHPAFEANLELKAGDRSGLYEIEALIKHGAEAQLYRAKGLHAKPVIIKLFNHGTPLPRIINEEERAAAVRHPSIVRVDSKNRWEDGRFYIAFDWVSERNLRDEIEAGNRPDLERLRRVTLQLLEALKALHEYHDGEEPQPILHNDIKPENILLTEGDRPVLIDFGLASQPRVGLYEGTEGYVAPDLRLGQDRKYCVDGDLFALGVTLFEWFFGQLPYETSTGGISRIDATGARDDAPPMLIEWFQKAVACESEDRFQSAEEMLREFKKAVAEKRALSPESPARADTALGARLEGEAEIGVQTAELEDIHLEAQEEDRANPFVAYLNSLHCRSAGAENALAESQARNALFSLIHVPHPVTDRIQSILLSDERRHVILTGHAGDGKSTIAIELYKRLRNLPLDAPLDHDLGRREDVRTDIGLTVAIVKDFSEWPPAEQAQLIDEMLSDSGPRFFLISNTGTLLNTFRDYERQAGGDWARTESDILSAIDSDAPRELIFHGTSFWVINLSMLDNLGLAERIFERMIAEDRWTGCEARECRLHCPIFRNVELIRQNEHVVRERIFLAYRRVYEYGTRFTLRQLTAHLAYMITSGLNHQDVVRLCQKATPPRMAEFMFFNRFFGDNGCDIDESALQLHAIREIRKQRFGTRPCPTWERRLWMQSRGGVFTLDAVGFAEEFEELRQYGARLKWDERITDVDARRQVRRMLYFLHRFEDGPDNTFVKTFLNSLMISAFARWQKRPEENLSLQESSVLRQRVLHVLQEHFSGVRLPAGAPADRHLFITLSRRSYDVRQSAQVVLARFPEDDFVLRLVSKDNGIGGLRRELVLETRGGRFHAALPLSLPFLDYVMMRRQGEVGEGLQPAYVDRLERFRATLLRQAEPSHEDDIMLVRLRTNHTFRRQIFAVRDNRLEVTDA